MILGVQGCLTTILYVVQHNEPQSSPVIGLGPTFIPFVLSLLVLLAMILVNAALSWMGLLVGVVISHRRPQSQPKPRCLRVLTAYTLIATVPAVLVLIGMLAVLLLRSTESFW